MRSSMKPKTEIMDLRNEYVPSHGQFSPQPGYPNPFMRRMMFPRESPAPLSHQNMMNSRIPNVHLSRGPQHSESDFNNQVKYVKRYKRNPDGHQQRPMSTPLKSFLNDVYKQIAGESQPTEPHTSSKAVTFSPSTPYGGASTKYGKDGTTLVSLSKTGDTLTDEENTQSSSADSNGKSILSLTKYPNNPTSKLCQVTKYICATLFLGLLAVMTFGIYASATGFLDAEKTAKGNQTLDIL